MISKMINEHYLPFPKSEILSFLVQISQTDTIEDIKKIIEKGIQLELFMNQLFTSIEGLEIHEMRKKLKGEEIDIILKNQVNSTFWAALSSPFIFVECKNWSNKVTPTELRDFIVKIRNHRMMTKIEIIISVNGFTQGVYDQLKNEYEFIILLISGAEIEKVLKNPHEMSKELEDLMVRKMIT